MSINDNEINYIAGAFGFLGDGAYVREGSYKGEVVLFTTDGMHTTNTIVLEPFVLAAFLSFLKQREIIK